MHMSESLSVGDFSIPKLGLGTWQLAGETCARSVELALRIGYRHVDTAQLYGNEREVGDGIRAAGVSRDDLFVTTKVNRGNLAGDKLRSSVEASLADLQTDYIDLLLIHWPNRNVPLEESLDAMRSFVSEGRVRHLGVSNFPPSLLRRALNMTPLVNVQVEYHPYLSQEVVLQLARANNMVLTAYSPLAKGHVFRDKTLKEIADAHRKTVAQIVLRWLIQQESVVTVPRSANPDHIKSNFEVWDFELGLEDIDRIGALARGQRIVNPSFVDWEREDEVMWWKGRPLPSAAARLIMQARRAKRKLRRMSR